MNVNLVPEKSNEFPELIILCYVRRQLNEMGKKLCERKNAILTIV